MSIIDIFGIGVSIICGIGAIIGTGLFVIEALCLKAMEE